MVMFKKLFLFFVALGISGGLVVAADMQPDTELGQIHAIHKAMQSSRKIEVKDMEHLQQYENIGYLAVGSTIKVLSEDSTYTITENSLEITKLSGSAPCRIHSQKMVMVSKSSLTSATVTCTYQNGNDAVIGDLPGEQGEYAAWFEKMFTPDSGTMSQSNSVNNIFKGTESAPTLQVVERSPAPDNSVDHDFEKYPGQEANAQYFGNMFKKPSGLSFIFNKYVIGCAALLCLVTLCNFNS